MAYGLWLMAFFFLFEVAIFKKAMTNGDIKSISKYGLEMAIAAVSPAGKLTTTWASIKKK